MDNKNLLSDQMMKDINTALKFEEHAAFERLLDMFPETKKSGLFDSDPTIRALLYMLRETNNPYTVLDKLLVHLYKVEMQHNKLVKSLLLRIPPGTSIEEYLMM